jgi:hypothetical protein
MSDIAVVPAVESIEALNPVEEQKEEIKEPITAKDGDEQLL